MLALSLRAYNRLEGQPGAKHCIQGELGPYTNTASYPSINIYHPSIKAGLVWKKFELRNLVGFIEE